MSGDLVLECPGCAAPALADDEFCESCGRPLADRRDAARHHFEIDAGTAAGVSDRGLLHARNEDALFVATADRGTVVVVCDGVSSSAAPQVAAQVAADAVGRELLSSFQAGSAGPASAEDAVAGALQTGLKAVLDVPWMPSRRRDAPSCTIVAVRWDGVDATIGWAGDSRAYWIAAGEAQLLSRDHSWAQVQVDAGTMSAAAAEADGRAHVITRWLGPDAPEAPAIGSFRPPGPGRIVACSDGLWNHVATTDELATLVTALPPDAPPLTVARALTLTALGRGGHDNVTVAVLDVPGERIGAT